MSGKAKVLVVDDEVEFVENIEHLLSSEGFTVTKAHDGNEALLSFERERPDVVLLDIKMPNLNGFRACERLRQDQDNAHIPIIMLTAHNTESDIVEALQAGADDYISKPFDLKELSAKVTLLIDKSKVGKLPSQHRRKK